MVGLEVRSQVDQMFVDGVGLEFKPPPGIKIFFWDFFHGNLPPLTFKIANNSINEFPNIFLLPLFQKMPCLVLPLYLNFN
jgi:hypothetical protein